MQLINLMGQKFGRLTVIDRVENARGGQSRWLCVCECGTQKEILATHLRQGRIVSCGCRSREITTQRNTTHQMAKTRLYAVWCGMKRRCSAEKSRSYKYYGRRGISVCDEWSNDFVPFATWAQGNGYSKELTIDRIDVNGNYEPSNCRWADRIVQANNKTNNHNVDYNGQSHTVSEMAREHGMNYNTLLARIKKGLTTERALTDELKPHAELMRDDLEYRKNCIKKMKENKPNKKTTIMIDVITGNQLQIFEKIADATRWICENTKYKKADAATIRKCAQRGMSHRAYGYRWRVLDHDILS